MKPADKFAPYDRSRFLAGVAAGDRTLAARLCELLEAAFEAKDIAIYSGFPIVVRDMEWIAGFAMRKSGPVAYCCSPATLAAMGDELKPYMSGKSCIAVKARKGERIDDVVELVGRAFRAASRAGGMISKTDARKRERARQAAAANRPVSRGMSKPEGEASAAVKSGTGARSTSKSISRSTSKSISRSTSKSISRSTSKSSPKPTSKLKSDASSTAFSATPKPRAAGTRRKRA